MPRPLRSRTARRRRSVPVALAAVVLAVPLASLVAAPPASANSTLPIIEDFEGTVPLSDASPGIFTFHGDDASNPPIAVVAAPDRPGAGDDNHALNVPYTITSYGGFSDNLAAAENWSSYQGFSFWVKGTNTGQRVEYEIKDGGTDGEHAELWQAFFVDDSSDWRQIQTPFSDLVHRGDYQPPGSPQDNVLSLTSMWGLAVNLPAASTGNLTFDDFGVYGQATANVTPVRPTVLVDAGGTALVPVRVTTPSGSALQQDVTVAYEATGTTAVAGTDFQATDGTLVFPAGTPSGTVKNVRVVTLPNTTPSEAKSITVTLTSDDATVARTTPTVVVNAHGLPYLDASLPVADRVSDLMSRMDLAEKVGQMTQAERAAVGDGTDITKYLLGSLLSGGGSVPAQNTAKGWANMIDGYQTQALSTPLQIPLIYGVDSVHGHNNLAGATLFPHNIGIGATRDPALAYQEGVITATETRATGVPWAFAPCVCVSRDPRWGRSYEAYSEDPALVQQLETVIDGLQGDGDLAKNTAVLATAKHFLGDGGTTYGTGSGSYTIDQGITYATQQQLNALYVGPYKTAVDKNVGTVMPSYSSLQILGKDAAPIKMHARGDMITGLLKNKLGFKGFVISDYAAIDQIGPDYTQDIQISINAGLDMIMVPNDYPRFTAGLTSLANSGDVTGARIDDAVRRILTQKFELGLFEHPFADRTNAGTIGSAAHRAVARQAVAESQVLLKNDNATLPLAKSGKIYVAGSASNDVGNQSGGWTLTWQGQSGAVPGGTSILAGIKQVAPSAKVQWSKDASAATKGYSVGIVAVGDTPYAEGQGDVGVNGHTLQLSVADKAAVQKVCAAMKCIVLDVSGRPLDLTGIAPQADAVVASWLIGSEGAGVADVLFGNRPFTGRLPLTWYKAESQLPMDVGSPNYDPLFAYGWGLRTDTDARARLQQVRDAVEVRRGNGAAVSALNAALVARYWNADGSVARPADLLPLLQTVADAMNDPSRFSFTEQDHVVSVVRDLAQAAIVAKGATGMAATAVLTSNAEHALMTGKPASAARGLIQARDAALRLGGKVAAPANVVER
ncbi:glycoside hydrolase family 3 N-terminal domain-containing protein [Jatrophihabitans sp. YIM 134969]